MIEAEKLKEQIKVELSAEFTRREQDIMTIVKSAAAQAKEDLQREQSLWKRPEFWAPLMVSLGLGVAGFFVSVALAAQQRAAEDQRAKADARLKEMEIVARFQDTLTGTDEGKKKLSIAILQEYVDAAHASNVLLALTQDGQSAEVASAARAALGSVVQRVEQSAATDSAKKEVTDQAKTVTDEIAKRLVLETGSAPQAFRELRLGWRSSDVALRSLCEQGQMAPLSNGAGVWNGLQFIAAADSKVLGRALAAGAPCAAFVKRAESVLTDPNDGSPALLADARRALKTADLAK